MKCISIAHGIPVDISCDISTLKSINALLIECPEKRQFFDPVATHEAFNICVEMLMNWLEIDDWNTQRMDILKCMLEWCRNVCAGVKDNQIIATQCNVHKAIDQLVLGMIGKRNVASEDGFSKNASNLINMGVQALANMATDNSETQSLLWSYFLNDSQLLSMFLLYATEDEYKFALIWIYNSVHGNGLHCQMLVGSKIGLEIVSQLLKIFSESQEGLSFDASYACLKSLISNDLIPDIWTNLKLTDDNAVSDDHVVLLKALDGVVSASTRKTSNSLYRTSVFLLNELISLTNAIVDNLKSAEPQLDPSVAHYCAFMVLILQYMAVESQIVSVETKEQWLNLGLMKCLLDLLHGVNEIQPKICKTTKDCDALQSDIFFMIKCDIMKVIANMAFECKSAQDEVRNRGGIPLVLSHCVMDDLNPYLREYSLFAVRNIVHGNAENQALISSLEAKKVVPNEMLDEMRVEAKIDANGKLKLFPK